MKWYKYKIETTNEATDIVASVLFDNGIVGAEIDDSENLSSEDLKKMYVDIPVLKENNGKAYVIFYVSISDEDIEKNTKEVVSDSLDNSYIASNDNIFTKDKFDNILDGIVADLDTYRKCMDIGSLNISIEELDDEIFLNKWKENFKRQSIDDIVIIPNFDKEPIDESKVNIYIEPGSAFGTGKHSTTSLCLRAISDIINTKKITIDDSKIIDIGCGSGILAIAAKKLGVSYAHALDADISVRENLLENIKLNFGDKKAIDYSFGNLIDDISYRNKIFKVKYDIVVANILAPIIISLIDKVHIGDLLKDEGYFICSGIIKEKEEDVKEALISSDSFSDIMVNRENDWVCFVAKRSKK